MNRRRALAVVGTGGVALAGGMIEADPAPPLRISLTLHDIYSSAGKLDLPAQLRRIGYGYLFFVVIENVSPADQFVWDEFNSMGHDTVWFEVMTEDGTKKTIKRCGKEFSKNIPRLVRLVPGEKHVRAVEYDPPSGRPIDWEFPFGPRNAKRSVTVQGMFEQPQANPAANLAVFSGRIASPVYKVVLSNESPT